MCIRDRYEITFDVGGETYTYQTTDANEFAGFQRGSEWQLEINLSLIHI